MLTLFDGCIPVIRSSFSRAEEIDDTASSMSTITPLRMPEAWLEPTPITVNAPSGSSFPLGGGALDYGYKALARSEHQTQQHLKPKLHVICQIVAELLLPPG
jgi:hypothetical protein